MLLSCTFVRFKSSALDNLFQQVCWFSEQIQNLAMPRSRSLQSCLHLCARSHCRRGDIDAIKVGIVGSS